MYHRHVVIPVRVVMPNFWTLIVQLDGSPDHSPTTFSLKMALMITVALSGMVSHAEHWASFKQTFGKKYAVEEEAMRFDAFVANLRRIEEENKAQGQEVSGITKFADLTPAEFKAKHLMRAAHNKTATLKPWDGTCTACVRFPEHAALLDAPPESFDWTEHGAVTPVKDQVSYVVSCRPASLLCHLASSSRPPSSSRPSRNAPIARHPTS